MKEFDSMNEMEDEANRLEDDAAALIAFNTFMFSVMRSAGFQTSLARVLQGNALGDKFEFVLNHIKDIFDEFSKDSTDIFCKAVTRRMKEARGCSKHCPCPACNNGNSLN